MRTLTWLGMTLTVLMGASGASAFEVKHTTSGQPVQWLQPEVSFVIDPSIEAAVPGGAAAVASAVSAWSGVSGAPKLATSVGPGGGQVAIDGQNTILLAPDGYGPAGDALAVTVLSFDETTGIIVDADIVINGIHAFQVLTGQATAAQAAAPVSNEGSAGGVVYGQVFDIQHVTAHEVGHSLGLGDVPQDDALMYAYTLPDDASNRAPLSDDTSGLASLYDAPHGGCGQASAAGAHPANGMATTLAVLSAAALILVRRRRARFAHARR